MKTKTEIRDELVSIIDKEVSDRRNMMNQMVGSLYPEILNDECSILLLIKNDLYNKLKQ